MEHRAQAIGASSGTAGMTEQVRLFDWGRTPLGAYANWPASLRATVNMMLSSCRPSCLVWGDELISVYNDAFHALLGSKPDALGRPFSDVWAEVWPNIGPLVERAQRGEAGYAEDVALVLERRGGREHTWWMFSFSPATDESDCIYGVLCVAHETTKEVEARAARPLERQGLALLFDQAPGFIAYLSGPNHVFQLVNRPQFHQGLTVENQIGKSVREVFPELEGQGVSQLLDEVYRSGERRVVDRLRLVFADASGPKEHYITCVYEPVRDDHGAVVGIFSVGHDVTEQILAEEALREREDRLTLALDAGRMAVLDVDLGSRTVVASPELNRMLGLAPDAIPSLDEVNAHMFPGEMERVRALHEDSRRQGQRFFEAEYRLVRSDTGEVRWLLIRAINEFSEGGAARRVLGVLMDITERKEAEERLKLLALEVDHRANNLLASVQSVVSLTRGETAGDLRQNVLGRISALAHAHRLLSESRWKGARLTRVVREELQPFMSGRQLHVEGPDANLVPAAAQGLAVVLHELVTNAVKHGALSTEHGRIDLSWETPDRDRLVEMTWVERGGPPAAPPTRAGFGMTLLRRALGGAVGGSVDLDWRPEGLRCRLRIPVL